MVYYTKRKKKKKIKGVFIFIIFFLVIINMFIIFFDRRVMPTVLELAKSTMKNKIIRVVNEISIEAYDELFKNEKPLDIKTDKDGNINMMSANTMKLNKLNGIISTRANEAIHEMGTEGIKVPLGWVTDSSIYYEFGPDITVNVDPIGNVSTNFRSNFESAGINQTRYIMYLEVEAKVNVQIPLYMEEIVVKTEVPLAEEIIVGKIPNTAVDLGQFGSSDFESSE